MKEKKIVTDSKPVEQRAVSTGPYLPPTTKTYTAETRNKPQGNNKSSSKKH